MTDIDAYIQSRIDQAVETHLPAGGGQMSAVRLRQALTDIATYAWARAQGEVLLSLLTVEDVAAALHISPRRVRAIAAERHARLGVGWQVPGTRGTWLFRPDEVEQLRPGPPGNPSFTHRD